jgi:PTH1 family peptidyl-tRNA hydrolase
MNSTKNPLYGGFLSAEKREDPSDRDKRYAMDQQGLHMVVGLGNPGQAYANTRHNAGFLVVDHVARKHAISVQRKKFDTVYGRGSIRGIDVILAKPMAFMNRSGIPVQSLLNYFKISMGNMLVIHDDIDLVLGRLKIKRKGGDGGHKGIRSIMDAFGGGEFTRLRIGIGRSAAEKTVTDHVLGPFHSEEKQLLEQILERSLDAVETILCESTTQAMNRFNDRRTVVES